VLTELFLSFHSLLVLPISLLLIQLFLLHLIFQTLFKKDKQSFHDSLNSLDSIGKSFEVGMMDGNNFFLLLHNLSVNFFDLLNRLRMQNVGLILLLEMNVAEHLLEKFQKILVNLAPDCDIPHQDGSTKSPYLQLVLVFEQVVNFFIHRLAQRTSFDSH